MHKSGVQQRQQWTTTIGSVCQNTSCGGDLDGVVQTMRLWQQPQHALNKKTTLMHLAH
jgi:hypothetical protein